MMKIQNLRRGVFMMDLILILFMVLGLLALGTHFSKQMRMSILRHQKTQDELHRLSESNYRGPKSWSPDKTLFDQGTKHNPHLDLIDRRKPRDRSQETHHPVVIDF